MSNADILMGVIALLTYVFIVCPCLAGIIASDAKYLDAVKGGVIFTLFCVALVGVITACWVSVMYFTDSLKPGTPATQFIDWVNSL
ncbi:TMhelix containing protein [Vibrio phage 1.271.B._10N.286.54.B4]|nr:TMhelix containing protein [Vibrio phage 1.027.O._10N.286.54.B8]AUR92381.1 TMhelix containing protein [Vibrio phage 1.171.O._10N.261.52.F12]AUR94434.1 TMhelix containing protein [Vibrio phage 1.194.O._10N.286.54.B1]AUR94522.1 TMhelix containing protein [Vibrio phage 1.195.O._10N.286.54.C8]AUR94607.1 TMhelix containing protein [Vibrio phage 1.196.O._10N.286.54.E12]AUR95074.1 TMhelix containing protein [Vibrio phage 1.200.O._10N.286.55.E1]AUR99562.1 TMhelix containing protein [Vibrio phage 1